MDFGVNLLTRGITGNAEGLLSMARQAEALGFGHVTINDHIVVPNRIASRYPYTPTGEWPGARAGECLEQVTALGFLAAATSRVRLVTSVMVVPQRPAVLAAKALATVDVLSQGRLTVGVGVGWLDEEFRAVAAPPFAARGAVTDEFLAAFHELWTSDAPSFAGKYVAFRHLEPKPVQRPRPPIGWAARAGWRFAARLGDGWYPVGNNPQEPSTRPGSTRKAHAAGGGADGGRSGHHRPGYLAPGRCQPSERKAPDGRRHPYTGRAADVAADIAGFTSAGVAHFFLSFPAPSLSEALADLSWFAEEVRPLIKP
jgi:probable F420-dependent oxidoreductase